MRTRFFIHALWLGPETVDVTVSLPIHSLNPPFEASVLLMPLLVNACCPNVNSPAVGRELNECQLLWGWLDR